MSRRQKDKNIIKNNFAWYLWYLAYKIEYKKNGTGLAVQGAGFVNQYSLSSRDRILAGV